MAIRLGAVGRSQAKSMIWGAANGQCSDLGVTWHFLGTEEGNDQPNKEHDRYQQIATDC